VKNNIKTVLAVCSLSMAAGIARGNLITNPSFETSTPSVTAGSFANFATGSTGITGWTVIGPASISAVSTTFAQNGVTFEAEDGNVWIDLTGENSNSTEGLQQAVTTATGTNYILTFFVGNTTGGGIFGTTSTVGLYVNGTEVNTYENSNADTTGLNWEQFTYNFTASSASTTIGFINLDPGNDNSNGLDLVDLEAGSSGGGLPEPASIGLVGAGLAVTGMLVRRKRLA
jgi:hypothetical protein